LRSIAHEFVALAKVNEEFRGVFMKVKKGLRLMIKDSTFFPRQARQLTRSRNQVVELIQGFVAGVLH
jgi:hypothetical protein